ncbi:MAG: hypothetical protein AAF632_18810 [Bacteroidota bacterium]
MRLFIATLSLAVSGCYSLSHVQQFTTEATEILVQGFHLEPTFYQVCQQRQRRDLLQQGKLTPKFREGCNVSLQADSATVQILETLTRYLAGLHQLAASGRSGSSLAPLGNALQTLPLAEGQADVVASYQELAQLSLTGLTERSRRKKAQDFIERAEKPLQTLLNAYQFMLNESLAEQIRRQQYTQRGYSRELLDSAHSFIEKKLVIEEYMDQMLEYEAQLQSIQQYVDALNIISEGHTALYQQRTQLHQQEVIGSLLFYTNYLRQMQLLSKF